MNKMVFILLSASMICFTIYFGFTMLQPVGFWNAELNEGWIDMTSMVEQTLAMETNSNRSSTGGSDANSSTMEMSTDKISSADGTVKININGASQSELETLPGIGPSKARAVIDYRSSFGPFQTIEQLTEVKGIGEKTLEKLKPLITIQ